ncbi:hypothetical protein [Flavobacterium sasangense]|uniref:hypothetical protein n=1 Tax=Flavobacterium sasangense TaxID=503361 RepID=UPI000478B6D0|nr:hypothetical protein [Flavobacterium sasangense]
MGKSYLNFSALLLLVCGFYSVSFFAQTPEKHNLIGEVEELMYSNPNQAVKIAQHLLSTPIISEEEKAKANLLIAKAYLAKGDLSACLKSLFQEKQQQKYLTIPEKAEVELLKSTILRYLCLYKESETEITNCDLLIKNNSNDVTSDSNAFLLIEKAKHKMMLEKIDEAINVLDGIKLDDKSNSEVKLWKFITLGKLHLDVRLQTKLDFC